jgi:hypothetical protein
MLRVTPTKLQLKAEDSQEYERHKTSWKESKIQEQSNPSPNPNPVSCHRDDVRARLGITPSVSK